MTSARALVGIGSLLVATTSPALLLGGCTTQGMATSSATMAQPAPRARLTTGAASYTPVTDQRLVESRGRELADVPAARTTAGATARSSRSAPAT